MGERARKRDWERPLSLCRETNRILSLFRENGRERVGNFFLYIEREGAGDRKRERVRWRKLREERKKSTKGEGIRVVAYVRTYVRGLGKWPRR